MIRKLAILVLALALAASPAAANTINIKAQSMFDAGQPIYKNFVKFCENVKTMSGGRLVIKPLPAGSIVPTFELLDAMKNNVMEAMHSGAVNYSGKEPALAMISDTIYAWRAPWESEAWFYWGGGRELLNEFYHKFNTHAVGVVQWGFESFPSKFPIKSMADYKGHKFRSPQGMTSDSLGKLGASAVILPGGEVYSALDKGVIDGTDWGTPSMNLALGFNQVCKYFVYPEYRSMPMSEFSIRLDIWNKMSDDLKAIVEAAVKAWNVENMAQLGVLDLEAVQKWESDGGKAISWSPEAVDEMRTFVRTEIWPLYASRSDLAKRVMDSITVWLVKIGTIQ